MTAGICARDITVAFDGQPVLHHLDADVRPGAVTGLLGPSGSGKTTLLRVLAGLQRPTAGSITYDGAHTPPTASIAKLAQSPRQACNPRRTLREIIAEPARAVRRVVPDLDAIAAEVGLPADLLDRYPAQVSDGQLQRACVGRILVQKPRYLLCDEPTAMLDPIASRAVIALIDGLVAEGVGAALVSHDHRLIRARCSAILTFGESSG